MVIQWLCSNCTGLMSRSIINSLLLIDMNQDDSSRRTTFSRFSWSLHILKWRRKECKRKVLKQSGNLWCTEFNLTDLNMNLDGIILRVCPDLRVQFATFLRWKLAFHVSDFHHFVPTGADEPVTFDERYRCQISISPSTTFQKFSNIT